MAGKVVHVKKDAYDVYIGRGSKGTWGNPFKIGAPHPQTGKPITRGEAITLYKEYIVRGEGRHLLRHLGELEGQVLGCFCAEKNGVGAHDTLVCHGQILLLLLEHRRRKVAEKKTRQRKERKFRRVPPARYIFFGSRTWNESVAIRERLDTLPKDATIVVGGAKGADKIAEQVARRMGFEVEVLPAKWDEEGRSAGYRRNERMANLPNVKAAFGFRMPGKSNGTDHMAKICKDLGVETVVQRPAKSNHLAQHLGH